MHAQCSQNKYDAVYTLLLIKKLTDRLVCESDSGQIYFIIIEAKSSINWTF